MRMKSVVWIALLLACAAPLAQAQNDDLKLKVDDFAPDFGHSEWKNDRGEPPSLKELRGITVAILYFDAVGGSNEGLMQAINLLEANPVLGKSNGVQIIMVTNAKRPQVDSDLVSADA